MNVMSSKAIVLGFGLALLCMTSSCTSKSKSASTQAENQAQNFAAEFSNDPLENLKKGNERFVNGKLLHFHRDSLRVKELIAGQNPQVVVVSCSDSRVTPEIIFDQGLGDIFTIRTAGNVMSDYEEGSIEYAVEHAGSKLIVVLGHTHCGAIHAMLETKPGEQAPGHIHSIVSALQSEAEQKAALELSHDSIEHYATIANVKHGVTQLRTSKPILKEKLDKGEIRVVGAVYNIETGRVDFLEL